MRAEDIVVTLNRSAIVVKPRQPFLDWLHTADPTSRKLTLRELVQEPTVYLIPECDTDEEVADVLAELCEETFIEQLKGWFTDTATWPQDRSSTSSAVGLTSRSIRCWLISAMNH